MVWDQINPKKNRQFSVAGGITSSFLAVVLVFVLDFTTGSEFSFSIFYLIPISMSTIMLGRTPAILTSILSALCWLSADLASNHIYSYFLIPYWNALVRLGYFLTHSILLGNILSSRAEMKKMAFLDPLTNAANWRYFEEIIKRSLFEMRRSRKPLSLCYIDLDNFKKVNDTFGHETGDDVLRTVVEIVHGNIRPTDMLARMGGDEFGLLLPGTDSENSRIVLSRIVVVFNSRMKVQNYPVTMSIGCVSFTAPPPSVESMIHQADELMYMVKKKGKNNIRYAEWPPTPVLR